MRGRANLARVYVLIDARHGLKDADEPMFEALGAGGGQPSGRADQVRRSEAEAELARRIGEVEAALTKRPAAFPGVLATSAREGTGIAELRAAIARLLAERRA